MSVSDFYNKGFRWFLWKVSCSYFTSWPTRVTFKNNIHRRSPKTLMYMLNLGQFTAFILRHPSKHTSVLTRSHTWHTGVALHQLTARMCTVCFLSPSIHSCDSLSKGWLLGSVAMATTDHMMVTHNFSSFIFLALLLYLLVFCSTTVNEPRIL